MSLNLFEDLFIPLDPVTAQPDPTQIRLISEPLTIDPTNPAVFLLTSEFDGVELVPGISSNYPGGILALEGADIVRGSADAEQILGNTGRDALLGNGGNDTLRGGQDNDLLGGSAGNDLLNGNQGRDYLYGGEDNDFVRGGQGDDFVIGGAGNDTVMGDLGVDQLWGSQGADLFVLRVDDAAPPQEIGSEEPQPIQLPLEIDILPSDTILDYNGIEGDRIGLTGGLTVNDLTLTERLVTTGDRRDLDPTGPYLSNSPRTSDFQLETFAVVIITQTSTGNILGLVRDALPQQLQFVSISDPELSLG